VRLWSLHPRYLDRQGLVACWRESLLAQAVLRGDTKGYRRHPQLLRFRATDDPYGVVASYLEQLAIQADARGYRFDRSRIRGSATTEKLTVTDGQLAYEATHLRAKLLGRSPDLAPVLPDHPDPHPLFTVVDGEVADWEIRA
jgi:hypothetical protein